MHNRRTFLAVTAALPVLAAVASPAAALPPEWDRLASDLAVWFPETRAAEVRATVARAHAAGFSRADFSGAYFGTIARPQAFTLCFGEWPGDGYSLVRVSGVLRYHAE